MPSGRPTGSEIRQRIVEILYHKESGYGYDIYQTYRDLFPAATMRSIYYHLKKGLTTQEFMVKEIRKEAGEYSWGGMAEKIYYALGPKAQPKGNSQVKKYIENKKKENMISSTKKTSKK
ncbi:MAG: hypothetical protein Q8P15_01565 [Nanoarchaeota archaeon]|nr:hypothetical protein [Nanoarchaeota archaeon]